VGCVLAVSVCGEQGKFPTTPTCTGASCSSSSGSDNVPPTVSIVLPTPPHDTIQDITDSLKFTMADTDNVKLKSVQVTVSGIAPYSFSFNDSAVVGVAGFVRSYAIGLKRGAAGHHVKILATAYDASGNLDSKTDTILIVYQKPPLLTMVAPAGATTIGAGSTLKVVTSASDISGVLYQGARLYTLNNLNQRVVLVADSNLYAAAPSNKTDTITVRIPATAVPGAYQLQSFARDSSPTPNDTVSGSQGVQVITVLAPFGNWVFPPQDTAVVAGSNFLASFDAKDSAGVASIAFTAYSDSGSALLGTFATRPRFTAIGATIAAPQPKDTTIQRIFNSLPDSSVDSVLLAATVTNVGGVSATIVRRIQVVQGRFARVTSPSSGSYQPIGAGLTVSVAAAAPDSLIALGFYVKRNPSVIRDSLPVLPHLVSASSTLLLPTWLRNYGASPQLPIGSVDTIVPFAYGKTSGYFEGPFSTVINVGAQITIAAPATVIAGDSLRVTSVRAQESLLQQGITSVTMYVQAIRATNVPCAGCADTVSRYQSLVVNLASALPVDTVLGPCTLLPVLSDSTAETAQLVVEVRDRAGAVTRSIVPITILKGPKANVTAPAAGTQQPMGLPLSVTVAASDTSQLTAVGFVAHGAARDSQTFAVAAYSASHTFALTVPPRVAPGAVDTIFPFAVGTLHPQFYGKPVLVTFVDTVKPGVTIQLPSKVTLLTMAVGDSVLTQVHVTDNTGVVLLDLTGVALRGSVSLGTDTVVTRYTERLVNLPQSTDTVITRYLRAATPLDSTGEFVDIVATARDSSGNKKADTTVIRVVSGPRVTINSPSDSSVTSPNKIISVSVHAKGTLGVKKLGWRAAGVVTFADSVIASPVGGVLSDTLTFTSNLTIPSGTPVGQISITAFAADTNGNPSAAVSPRTVFVQSTATTDVTPPVVSFSVPLRVEVGDSITVTASDPGGIAQIGFIVHHLGLADTVQLARWADTLNGTNTNVIAKFRLNLDTMSVSTAARQVTVEAFAFDSVGNHGVSSFSGVPKSSPADQDTLTVVAGRTISFPQGGQFGDAIVDPNNQTLYLTNTLLDQLEVFHLASNTFDTPIRVGSQPVGIALWPRDTLGDNADTVIVANSGGTNLSIVNLNSGAEVARHTLPDYIVSTVKTQPTAAGGIQVLYTPYDLSDRPQYVAATCRHLTAGACDSVIAVYSTTPTPAASGPFANHGYLAWENLTAPQSVTSGHFFYELAAAGTDTIEITAVRDTLPGQPLRYTILGAGIGYMVTLSTLAFQESTFVHNSGDFNHAVIGEGGLNQGFARALTYDARRPLIANVGQPPCPLKSPTTGATLAVLNCDQVIDPGVSDGVYISDFLVNRASKVLSVATNFNGRTNLVRADSIYAFDAVLKQAGLFSVGGTNPGMDFDPKNAFDADTRTSGALNKNDRLMFAARPDASIDVFDTYWSAEVARIPIRDTVIGPMRVAYSGGTLVLFGVTARGLVVASVPSLTNPLPSSPTRPSSTVTNGKPVIIRASGKKVSTQR